MLKLRTFTDFFQTKYQTHPIQSERTFYLLQSFCLSYPDNKTLVKELKKLTLDYLDLNHQQYYEDLSNLAGFENYNVAKDTGINFYELFNPLKTQTLSSLWLNLDNSLGGGFKKGEFTTIGAGVNMGKSQFITSLGCNFLRQGFKVLHINLEGRADSVIFNYTANLSKTPRSDIQKGVKVNVKKFNKNLKVHSFTGFGTTINQLVERVKEIRKTFSFDVLLVDYGQLLEGNDKNQSHFQQTQEIYEELRNLARDEKCVVLSPFQFTRRLMNDPENINHALQGNGEARPIFDASDNVLTLAREQQDGFNMVVEISKKESRPLRESETLTFQWEPRMSLFFEQRK